MDLDNLEDTRKAMLIDEQPKKVLCEEKIKKAVSSAIYKVFPKDLENINKTLEQYNKAIKSNVITRFDYFDFENLEKKTKIIEDMDQTIKSLVYGVKQLTNDMMYEKDNINKISEEWIKKINEAGEFNTDKIEIVDQGINHLKSKIKNIEKSKTTIFNLTNILLVVSTMATGLNTYYIFFY